MGWSLGQEFRDSPESVEPPLGDSQHRRKNDKTWGEPIEEFNPSMTTLLPVDHAGSFVYVSGWQVPETQKQTLLFVHDIDQQSDHLHHLCQSFADRNHSCYTYDLRGHGRSGTLLGHIEKFDVHVKDLLQVASWVKYIDQRQPPVIVAFGVGALIAMEFAKRFASSCSGLILVAPCLELKEPPHGVWRIMMKFIADFWPKMRGVFSFTHWKSSEKDSQRLTLGYVNEIYQAIDHSSSNLSEYHGDLLFLCPDQDTICSYQNLKKAAAVHQEYNLTLVDVPGDQRAFHVDSPHLDLVMNTIVNWLNNLKHLKKEKESKDPMITRESLFLEKISDKIAPGSF